MQYEEIVRNAILNRRLTFEAYIRIMQHHILVAEDDSDIQELVRITLEKAGYRVYTACEGHEAWNILLDEHIDLAVLDIGLPSLSGLDVLRRMKQEERLKSTPVVFATARTQEQDLLIGFQTGANDYIRKPFSPKELLARINSLLKSNGDSTDQYHLGSFDISFPRHLLKISGQRILLTHHEFGVLQALIKANGRTSSREQLLENVWGTQSRSGSRSVDIVITRIREKISPYNKCIRTITGIGYQWDVEQVPNLA